jgi:nitrogen fixation protein NifX
MIVRKFRLIEAEAGGPASAVPSPAEGGLEMKVAFATHDMTRVDAHFAGARHFAIYSVSTQGSRFLEAVQFDGEGQGEARVAAKIEAIHDCAILFVAAIGGPAAARVVNSRIHPVKARENEPIADILARLEALLCSAPPPWLRKAVRKGGMRDFSFLEEEDDNA